MIQPVLGQNQGRDDLANLTISNITGIDPPMAGQMPDAAALPPCHSL